MRADFVPFETASPPTGPGMYSTFGSKNTEGTKFWLKVMNELKNRGVGDILIAVVESLKGFPHRGDVPRTIVQTCIVDFDPPHA